MSIVVAFDTATDHTALAIGERSGESITVVLERDFEAPRAALSRLVPELQEALTRTQLIAEDIDEIVIGLGPGSFTGVRIGVSTAKGLAHALRVPLYGVGTLDAIGWRSCGSGPLIGVVGDAMRGEVYPMLLDADDTGVKRRHDEWVCKPEVAAALWAEELEQPVVLTGNGLAKYADIFDEVLGDRASFAAQYLWDPSGRALLAMYAAARQADSAGDGDPAALLPVYTRLSDAEETEIERAVAPPDRGETT